MSWFTNLITPESESSIRGKIIAYARGARLAITNWALGGVGQQVTEIVVKAETLASALDAKTVRGYASLDTSTDPGDDDPYDDTNATLEPDEGNLSQYGYNTFDTPRGKATYAVGDITFHNGGSEARAIAPRGLVFTWTANNPPIPAPTYHNVSDPSIYTNPDGTVTVEAGASIVLPVECDVLGAAGTCPSNSLSLTTSLINCTATNVEAIIGTDRESAESYRVNCRLAASRLSFNGPADAVKYFATHNIDGSALMNDQSPPSAVSITRAWVSNDSSTGDVKAYFASATGAAIAEDVTAANRNIELVAFVIGDCVSYTGASAQEVLVHVAGTVTIRHDDKRSIATIKQAIVDALIKWWPTIAIGGFDGYLYAEDIRVTAGKALPGLYKPTISTPNGDVGLFPDTPKVATLQTSVSDWEVLTFNE